MCFFLKKLFWWKWNHKKPRSDTNCYLFWSPLSPTIETEHIYISILKTCHDFHIGNERIRVHFAFRFEQGMDLLRLWRAPPLTKFSLTMGAGEKTGLFLFQNDVMNLNRHLVFGFIPSCLRGHTLWLLGLTSLKLAHHLRPVIAMGSTHKVAHTMENRYKINIKRRIA